MYGDPSLGLDTHSKKGNDFDGDGVVDDFDPCPNDDSIVRWGQDLDGDGVSDVYDSDGDGLADICDNCPDAPNPMVLSSKEILIAPPQVGSDANNAGAYFNTTIGPLGLPVKSFTRFEIRKVALSPFTTFSYPVYYWQPDHDLDGVGDACDYGTATTKFDSISGNTRWTNNNRTRYENEYMGVLYSYWVNSDGTTPIYYKTQDYCWATKQEYQDTLWGTQGYCTTAHGNNDHRAILNFGYSHGSDPAPVRGGNAVWNQMSWDQNYKTVLTARRQEYPAWDTFNINEAHSGIRVNAKNTSGQYTAGYVRHQVPIGKTYLQDLFFWNWRNDVVQDNDFYAATLVSRGRVISGFDAMVPEIAGNDHDFYIGYSAGIKGANPLYITGDTVNADFFYNTKLAARAERYDTKPQPVTYIKRSLPTIPFKEDKYIIDRETWLAIVGSRFGVEPSLDQSWLGLWRYGPGADPHVDFKQMLAQTRALVIDDEGFLYSLVAGTAGGTETLSAYVNYPDNAGDWTLLGTGIKPDNIDGIVSARIVGGSVYLIGKDTNYTTGIVAYALHRISTDVTGAMTFDPVTSLPNDLKGMTLHDIGGSLYITGARGGVVEIYVVEGENAVLLSSAQKPPARDYSGAYASQEDLYLAGGVTTNQDGSYSYHRDIWNFVPGAGWTLMASNVPASMTALFMEKIGDILYLTSRIPNGGGNITDQIAYNTVTGETTVTMVTVPELPTAAEDYCLAENNDEVKGGLTDSAGLCTPFTHPWYKSFSIGTTVYSVAGKGDRLYVGTNSTIRVYDISDPNAMVLKSTFTTNRRVYDLEVVEGDIMYAATSGGIYKFNTANPDAISQLSFYSTPYNYQYRIQYYNDKLYVGDDNGINIRDKETFARLAYVNFGSVVDFAIANGELALYWYAFWDEGVQVRDADTLTLKAYEYGYCSTGELTTDHGAFYLACDGYEYRFAGRPDTYIDFWELNGDIREMAENHLYNGWVYIPDGSAVKVSTNNEVPSYCGNGIVEPGEVCDGNSVYCEDLDPNEWNSGTAYCNSTCTGYDTGDCYWSGC